MNASSLFLFACLCALGITSTAQAAAPAHKTSTHDKELAAFQDSDPFETVYILTARSTYQSGLQAIAHNPLPRRDSVNADLVLLPVKAHQLTDISHLVHEKQKRCGGFFAFKTVADADAFIRNDRAAAVQNRKLLATYSIDNQSTVNPWLPQVSEPNIRATITHLSTAYQNRYYTSTSGQAAAVWIRDKWLSLANGRTDVSAELFTACSNCGTQPSVILTVQGTELPNEIVVLGGHLDSISNSGSGETMNAPGADDDASGIATLTEVLRIAMASGWKPKRTVKFMGYAAEEVGLRGSNAIAQSFKNEGKNVVGVLQLDMSNYRAASSSVDMRIITDYSNATLVQFSKDLFDAYLQPLGLTRGTYTCGYACSDHASWTSAGFPSTMMHEASNYSALHTANDTMTQMANTANASVALSKFALAFMGELAKTKSAGSNSPPLANFSFATNALTATFTDSSSDSDGSIATRSWNFGDGSASTASNPSKTYSAAGTYTVTLTVTDNAGASHAISKSVTVASTGGGNVLINGIAKTGISAATGTSVVYTMMIPTDIRISNLKFVTSGGTGDVDMYVKYGSAPTDTVYDCRPYASGNAETCNIATAQAGTYYIRLKAYSAFSGLSLTGSYTMSSVQTYTNTADFGISDNATVESPITVAGRSGNAPSNASVTVAIVHTYQGDLKVDLVAPDGSLYNIHNRTGAGTDNINKTVTLNLSSEALNGVWKLRVNDNGAGDLGRIDSWSITF